MGYIQRLAEIAIKELGDRHLYCIRDGKNKVIAGDELCEFYIRPSRAGGWDVFLQELGRGVIYEEYHLNTEREACIKFIEMTKDVYHLSRYIGEFEEEKLGLPKEYEYIYCSVAFEDGGRTWYYRTDDGTFTVGDYVVVPWNINNRRRFGRIEKIEIFPEVRVPFPLNRTKSIISHADKKEFITAARDHPTDKLQRIMTNFEQKQKELIAELRQEIQRLFRDLTYD